MRQTRGKNSAKISKSDDPLVRTIEEALDAMEYETAMELADLHDRKSNTLESRHLRARVLISSEEFHAVRACLKGRHDCTSKYYSSFACCATGDYTSGLVLLRDLDAWDPEELKVDLWNAYNLKGRLESQLGRVEDAAGSFQTVIDCMSRAGAPLEVLMDMKNHFESEPGFRSLALGRDSTGGALRNQETVQNTPRVNQDSENGARSCDADQVPPPKAPESIQAGSETAASSATEFEKIELAASHLSSDPKRTLKELDLLSHESSSHPTVLCIRFRAQHRLRLFQDAEATYGQIRRKIGNNNTVVDLYSGVLWLGNKEDELTNLVQEMFSINMADLHDWREGVRVWEKETRGLDKGGRGLIVLANLLSLRRKHDDAIEALKKAVQIDPHHAHARALLGSELQMTGEHTNAEKQYIRALSLDPKNVMSWHGLGDLYLERGALARAKLCFRGGLDEFANESALIGGLAKVFYREGEHQKALEAYQKTCELNSLSTLGYVGQAEIYEDRGDIESALEMLRVASEIDPADLRTMRDLARLKAKHGKQGGTWAD